MSIRSDLMYYFEHHPNEKVYLGDIAGELQLVDRQAQQGIYMLIKSGYEGIEVVAAGQCWLYKPPVAQIDKLQMTVIGFTNKGSRLLEDEEGELWVARKLDV